MKKTNINNLDFTYSTKAIAFFGMLISIFSFILAIRSILPDKSYDPINDDMGRQFEFWIYSYLAALPCLLFYLIDAIFCIARAFYKLDALFNLILGILIFGMIPMMLLVGSWYPGSIIWNVYHFMVFALEIISIIRAIRHRKTLPETPLST